MELRYNFTRKKKKKKKNYLQDLLLEEFGVRLLFLNYILGVHKLQCTKKVVTMHYFPLFSSALVL